MAQSFRGRERQFGLSVGMVCGLLAAYAIWRGFVTSSWAFAILAAMLIGCALTNPSLLRVPSALWWRAAHALGWLNTRLLLVLTFFLILTPLGLLARASGWDSLRITRRDKGSGWMPYSKRDPKHYERMY